MSNFKKRVAERVAKTGESWSTAARHVRDRVGFESHWSGVPADGFCGHCKRPVRAGQKTCAECGWVLSNDPLECLLHDELTDRQRVAIHLELSATARIGPQRKNESPEAYAHRRDEAMQRSITEGAIGRFTAELFADDVDDDDVDETADSTTGDATPSDEWLSAWRRARDALGTYCHTREPLHLEAFNEQVSVMHALDAAATMRDVRRMIDEIRPEWDPSAPVQPDLFGRRKR